MRNGDMVVVLTAIFAAVTLLGFRAALALMEGDAWGMENKKEARTDGQTFAGYLPAL